MHLRAFGRQIAPSAYEREGVQGTITTDSPALRAMSACTPAEPVAARPNATRRTRHSTPGYTQRDRVKLRSARADIRAEFSDDP